MIILSREDVKKALGMEEAISAMEGAFMQLSDGQAEVPVRMNVDMSQENGCVLLMPAYLPQSEQMSVKIVSIMHDNPTEHLPLIHAVVLVIDAKTGKPAALIDGEHLTALRTGAASGLATSLLARQDTRVVAVFGAGAQGQFQLEAMCKVREIHSAIVFDLESPKAAAFANEMSERLGVPVYVGESGEELSGVDVICTATTSRQPVFSHRHLKAGVHINAIGAYNAEMCEIPAETIQAAKVIVDNIDSALAEAGDLIQPIKSGLITKDHVYGEIGQVAAGRIKGREDGEEITVFKSVGNAVQDLAAASRILSNARSLGLGTTVDL